MDGAAVAAVRGCAGDADPARACRPDHVHRRSVRRGADLRAAPRLRRAGRRPGRARRRARKTRLRRGAAPGVPSGADRARRAVRRLARVVDARSGAARGRSAAGGAPRPGRRGPPRPRAPGPAPAALDAARAHVLRLIDQLTARFGIADDRLVLGGFSQGAMLSLDVALHRAAPPAGLVLMSGTLIAESVWRPRLPSLRGVPVMMSHGRHDALLPYHIAEILRDRLRPAGAPADWRPSLGGHEIPRVAIDSAGKLLRGLSVR